MLIGIAQKILSYMTLSRSKNLDYDSFTLRKNVLSDCTQSGCDEKRIMVSIEQGEKILNCCILKSILPTPRYSMLIRSKVRHVEIKQSILDLIHKSDSQVRVRHCSISRQLSDATRDLLQKQKSSTVKSPGCNKIFFVY